MTLVQPGASQRQPKCAQALLDGTAGGKRASRARERSRESNERGFRPTWLDESHFHSPGPPGSRGQSVLKRYWTALPEAGPRPSSRTSAPLVRSGRTSVPSVRHPVRRRARPPCADPPPDRASGGQGERVARPTELAGPPQGHSPIPGGPDLVSEWRVRPAGFGLRMRPAHLHPTRARAAPAPGVRPETGARRCRGVRTLRADAGHARGRWPTPASRFPCRHVGARSVHDDRRPRHTAPK